MPLSPRQNLGSVVGDLGVVTGQRQYLRQRIRRIRIVIDHEH